MKQSHKTSQECWSARAPGVSRPGSFSHVGVMAPDVVKIDHFNVVSHVAPKVLEAESQNFTGMLVSMYSCAPGVSRPGSFSHVGVMAPYFVKINHFNIVSRVTPKVFEAESQNFTRTLVSMYSCAPGVSRPGSFSHVGVISPYFVKISHFNVVSCIAPKVFEAELQNLTGMLISICSCALGVSGQGSFSDVGVIAPYFVKIGRFNVVSHIAPKIFEAES